MFHFIQKTQCLSGKRSSASSDNNCILSFFPLKERIPFLFRLNLKSRDGRTLRVKTKITTGRVGVSLVDQYEYDVLKSRYWRVFML